MLSPETLDLVRCLLDYEVAAGETSGPTEVAALSVYEKLQRPLCDLAGVAGFRALVQRALTLAKAEAPSLSAVQVAEDGSLQGLLDLGEREPQIVKLQAEGRTILIAHLLGLLLTFVGETLTMRLVQEVWPDASFDDGNSRSGRKV